MLCNLQCRETLLVLITVEQGLAVLGADEELGCLGFLVPSILHASILFLSPSVWQTARYKLKICLKELLKMANHFTIFYSKQISYIYY